MSLSSIIQQTEEVLDEVLRIIRQECEKPTSVLCETDRRDFVEDEESLRKRLRETEESNWRRLLCMPSPQAVKYLGDAKALRHRVKEDIRTKERTLIFGMGDPPSSLDHGQGPVINSMDARTPEANPGRLLADANSEPASSIITSPLNMRCSVTEASESELIVYPVARNDNDYTSDLHEAINTPLGTSSDRIRDSSSGGQRRSPPPPPTSRRMGQSTNSRQTTSISGSSRGSRPIRRPAAPPPPSTGQIGPGSLFNGSFLSLDPSANLAMMSSMSDLTQQVQRLQKLKRSEDYVTKINCVDMNGSNADGVTMNIGGSKNSGSVIHKTVWPQPIPA